MYSPKEEKLESTFRDDIIAMLTASGYHRARIASLNDYDRIVGGIAWALTRCDDVHVAADLLYDESEDQNIKLRTEQSEKIIESLKLVKCPFQLSAHQFIGLDFAALKNLVQWLLRRLLAKNKTSHKKFSNWFVVSQKSSDQATHSSHLPRRSFQPTTTRYKKRLDTKNVFNLTLDAKCTLAEYVSFSRAGDEIIWQKEEEEHIAPAELKEASVKKHVPTNTIREMMDVAVVDETLDESKTNLNPSEVVNLPEKISTLKKQISEGNDVVNKLKENHENLKAQYEDITRRIENSSESEIEQIQELLKTFKSTCLRDQELQEYLDADVEATKKQEELMSKRLEGHAIDPELERERRELKEKYATKTKEYADALRRVLELQFTLDQMISVNLSSHYRKRNMENLQNSASFTEEAKAAVIDYNVTVDILKFNAKITTFINQLEQSLLEEPSSQEYREAFATYMNNVRTQLGEYHWKAKQTQDKALEEKNQLAEVRSKIRQKEREVANISSEMRKMLQTNASLQKVLSELQG